MGVPGTSDEILEQRLRDVQYPAHHHEDVHTVAVLAAPQIGVSVGLAAGGRCCGPVALP
jgi:hypothetical protein